MSLFPVILRVDYDYELIAFPAPTGRVAVQYTHVKLRSVCVETLHTFREIHGYSRRRNAQAAGKKVLNGTILDLAPFDNEMAIVDGAIIQHLNTA